MKGYGAIMVLLMLFSPAIQALECEVEYRAKKVTTVQTWYGTVEKPKYKSGTLSGQGANRARCERNALAPIRRDNWKITYSKVTVTSP
ncbi:MAG: hypothetical protein R3F02_07660 [Thiolinea sp.]